MTAEEIAELERKSRTRPARQRRTKKSKPKQVRVSKQPPPAVNAEWVIMASKKKKGS
jgi:hypothetical protein